MFWSNDNRWHRSITFQMASSFAILMATLLIILFFSLYRLICWQLYREEIRSIKDAASLVETTLMSQDNVQTLLKKQIPDELSAFHFHHYLVRIIEPDAPSIIKFQSPHFPQKLRTVFNTLPLFNVQDTQENIREVHLSDGQSYLLLVHGRRIGQRSLHPIQIQIALNITSKVKMLDKLIIYFTLLPLSAIFLTALIGAYLVNRGLRPLRQLGENIQKINMDSLEQQLDNASWPTELLPLATSFNKLLTRLYKGVSQINRFSGDLAHELRTPITALRTETEVLLERPRTPEEYKFVLQNNLVEMERLSNLIERILLLARVENTSLAGNKKRFSLRPIVNKLLDFYTILADEKEISMTATGDLELYANRELVEQALGNLLSNAIKYGSPGGQILVELVETVEENGRKTKQLNVTDNGPGIDNEHLPFIFDRFYRGDASRSQLIEGDGLGLSIVKSIVDAHGGEVKVDTQIGQGSTFFIIFGDASEV